MNGGAAAGSWGGDQSWGAVKCYNCGEEGHQSRECPKPKKPMSCYNCGGEGHQSRECTEAELAGVAARALALLEREAHAGLHALLLSLRALAALVALAAAVIALHRSPALFAAPRAGRRAAIHPLFLGTRAVLAAHLGGQIEALALEELLFAQVEDEILRTVLAVDR